MRIFKGAYTAIVTPFDAAGDLDEAGLRENIHFQIEKGVDGIVVLGTTGESPTLSEQERAQVIRIALQESNGKIRVVVGTGTYGTAQTIKYTRQAQEMGADGALIVTPYYNKPTQEGMYRHFKAISEAVALPIILYNIQGRTGQNLQTETLRKLVDLPNIVGMKESSGSIGQIGDVIEMVTPLRPDFSVLSGDDGWTFSIMALGGHGVISVAANLIPKEIKALVEAIEKGDVETARAMHYQLMPLFRGIFIETNPMPIKEAMRMCGMAAGNCRLPLCELLPENSVKLRHILQSYAVYKQQMRKNHYQPAYA